MPPADQDPDRPSLDLLRRMTDRHVLQALLAQETLSRAEIAARTGLSKPTVSESVRRLTRTSLIGEVGRQSGRRGRAGVNLALSPTAGCALSLHAGPDGVIAERHDLRGVRQAQSRHDVRAPVVAGQLAELLRTAAEQALAGAEGPVLATTVSAADPVDRHSGRLIELPDSPFLTGELCPADVLDGLLPGPPRVDNDVNWAALAEMRQGCAVGESEFAYCYLGAGLGLGLVSGGRLLHGRRGLAGELAHVPTRGPNGASMRLVRCFDAWGLREPGTAAIDIAAVRRVLDEAGTGEGLREQLIEAVAQALSALTALLNPGVVVLGGPWGSHPALATALAQRLGTAPIPTEVRVATTGPEAPLIGARLTAIDLARTRLAELAT